MLVKPARADTRGVHGDSGADTLEALAAAPRFNDWLAGAVRPYVGCEVMEIGAGIGNITDKLISGRGRYILTDIDELHLARLKERFEQSQGTEIAYADLNDPRWFQAYRGQLDTAICINVLEHVEDDLAGLRNIRSVLKPGGTAIVLVPYGQRAYGSLDRALGHFRRYSRQELRKKMQQTGLHVERILDFNRVSRPGWVVSGRILKRTRLNVTTMRRFDRMVWLWKPLDRVLPWPPLSIIGIGIAKTGAPQDN